MTTTTEMKLVPLSKLVPYVNNARTHSPEQINKLRSSLREFGFINPVIIDRDYGVIAGHGRILAAKEEGISEVPCVFADHLTEAQKKAYILADNRMAMDAGWDEELLRVEIESLQAADFDLALTGFDEKELAKLFDDGNEGKEDDFDVSSELEKPVFSKAGDVWLLGRHRLVCGDSTDKATVELLMDGKKADMVFTDPPYGYEYQSNMRTKSKKFDVLKNDDKILDFMPAIKGIANGFVFICTTWKVLDKWLPLFAKYYDLTNMIIWDKGGGGIGDLEHTFLTDYEIILCANNSAKITGKRIGSVWNIPKDNANDYIHATQKPVKLSATAIENTTNDDDIVLDLFGGSGSTLIACEQLSRTCYMMELDPKYCDVIVRRYIEQVGGSDDVRVVRDGAEYKYNEVVTDA